jgi:hypothetical protein
VLDTPHRVIESDGGHGGAERSRRAGATPDAHAHYHAHPTDAAYLVGLTM